MAGLFLVRPASPLDGEAFFIDDGFIGVSDINIGPSRWVAGSDASISYTFETYPQNLEILLQGSVATPAEVDRLEALIQRFAPAHLTPVYNIVVDNNVWGDALYGLNRYAGI
jgi:hypothetical protein